jgi:hypothetical protein
VRRDLGQPPLDRGVDVLVRVRKLKGAGVELALDPPQAALDRPERGGLEDPGRGQAARVGDAARDVEGIELVVDRERRGESLELGKQLS